MSRAAELAMELSEPIMAKMKKQRTNSNLLRRYEERKDKARKKLDRAILKVLRASYYLQNMRNEIRYCDARMDELHKAIERGEVYPPKRQPKPKGGRRIEL